MIHKLISTFGLGILGIDPITAVYLLAMGMRKERKSKITLFFLSFAGFSILFGAILAAMFGVAAVDLLKSLIPSNESPFWAILNFSISVIIFVWVFRKLFIRKKKKDEMERKTISGSYVKYITTGILFAISCFTDPTYYAVILMGGETGNFLTAALLTTVWFCISQFMAITVYVAHSMNLLNKLVEFVEKIKQKNFKFASYVLYAILLVIALALLVDAGYFLFTGTYLY